MKTSAHIKPDYGKLSDEELIRRYVELHEYNAYNQLFVRFGHTVLGMCLSLHVGNAAAAKMKTEELFIAMLADIKLLKAGRFKPWLYDFVFRSIIGSANVTALNDVIAAPDLPARKTVAGIPDGLANEMSQLSSEEQLCIRLFYERNKSLAQIAEETGMSLYNIKKLLHSGKAHLANQLSLNDQLTHVFDESSCLTKRQVIEYISGNTETEENHAIEHHLNNCSLCGMAIEGLQSAPQESVMQISEFDTRFLHDHFSIAYPQVQMSSFVANGEPYKKAKTSRIPVWEQLLLALIVTIVVSVLFFTEKHNFHFSWNLFK